MFFISELLYNVCGCIELTFTQITHTHTILCSYIYVYIVCFLFSLAVVLFLPPMKLNNVGRIFFDLMNFLLIINIFLLELKYMYMSVFDHIYCLFINIIRIPFFRNILPKYILIGYTKYSIHIHPNLCGLNQDSSYKFTLLDIMFPNINIEK